METLRWISSGALEVTAVTGKWCSRSETLTVTAKWSPHAGAVHLTQDGTRWETSDAQWLLNISAADGAIGCFFDRQIETAASLSHTLPLPARIPSRPALFINPPSSSPPLPLSVKYIAQRKQSWDLHAWPCWLICIPDEKKKKKKSCVFSSYFLPFLDFFCPGSQTTVDFSEEMSEYDLKEIYQRLWMCALTCESMFSLLCATPGGPAASSFILRCEHVWSVMQGRLMMEAPQLPGRVFPSEATPARNVCSHGSDNELWS